MPEALRGKWNGSLLPGVELAAAAAAGSLAEPSASSYGGGKGSALLFQGLVGEPELRDWVLFFCDVFMEAESSG